MKATRILALVLSLMLIVAMFAGCQNDTAKTDDSSSSSSSSASTEKKEETKKEETKKEEEKKEEAPADPYAEGNFEGYPIAAAEGRTISLWHGTGMPLSVKYTTYEESPFHAGLEEQLGVDIDWQKPAQGANATQAYNLLIASGDLPNIIYSGGMPANANDLMEDGYIYRLDDYLPVYAPAYWSVLQNNADKNLSVKTDDSAYYGFAFFREDLVLGTYEGLMIRNDLLKQTGLDVPATIADWEEMLYAFKDLGVIPVSTWGIGSLNYLFTNPFDIELGYYRNDNNEVVYGYAEPGYKDFVTLMNKWIEEGLLDKDVAVNDRAAIKTLVMQDAVGAVRTSGSTVTAYLPELESLGSVAEWLPVPFPTANEGDLVKHIQRENDNIGNMAVITTATPEEDIGLCMRILDYGYTEEGMIYWNFGPEGGIMEFVDGEPHFTKEALADPEMSELMKMYMGMSSNGIALHMKDAYVDRTSAIGWEAMQAWFYTAGPSVTMPSITPTTAESAATANYETAISTYATENLALFIMGDRDIAEWDQYLADLEGMGLQTVLEFKTAQLDRYLNR